MAEKVTVMVLKVDLQCPCCYRKVKQILCKFPEIRDQVYDEKANTVTITVVCCNPEKLRDKLCCKGAKVIKSIEIKEPDPPKAPKPAPKPDPPKPAPKPDPPKPAPKPDPPKPPEPAPKPDPPKPPEPAPKPLPPPQPVYDYPPIFPGRTCCEECYHGYGGGPCYHGYGVPPPPPCYDGYYDYRRGCYVSRCDYYFSEENPHSCSIM